MQRAADYCAPAVRHIFVIPGWYPHRCFPFEGLFIQEQALAIGEIHPDWRVSLSLWGQGRSHLSLPHLWHSPRCLFDSLSARPASRSLRDNVVEEMTPAFSTDLRLLRGNRERILRANRDNLRRASSRFGPPDVLHAHVSYPAGWVAMKLSRETGIPYVVTEHMGPFPIPTFAETDGRPMRIVRDPLENAQAVIAVSPALADAIASLDLPRPRVIPNLVDERLYQARPFRAEPPFTFFTLCGMEIGKGIPDLIDAIARLLDSLEPAARDQVRFRLGGEGPFLDRYRRNAEARGLGRWVEWLGLLPRDRAREEFQSSDCFVLASHHESFGIVYIEAMASGRPVIATRCGGPEAFVNERNGLLVDVGDPTGLADALRTMLRRARAFDPAAIRAEFLQRYSRPAVVRDLESVYAEVAGSRQSTATVVAKS